MSMIQKSGKPVVVIADGWSQLFPSITAAAIKLGYSPQSLSFLLKHCGEDGVEIESKKYGMVCVDYAEEAL